MLPKFYLVLDVDDTLVNTELAIADVIRQVIMNHQSNGQSPRRPFI